MSTELPVDLLLHVTSSVFGFALLLVVTKRWHGALTLDLTEGVQKVHSEPTPRIGGIPILAGLALAWSSLPEPLRQLLGPLMLAAVPAVVFGLAEDMTRQVGVAARLWATLLSGVLFWWLSGYSVTRVDLPPANWALTLLPVS
ncbi:MAG: hypothetical protein RIS35_2208, partial [Pseudomonadota bacterium]